MAKSTDETQKNLKDLAKRARNMKTSGEIKLITGIVTDLGQICAALAGKVRTLEEKVEGLEAKQNRGR